MFESPFVHLHVHTHYSLLDGATRIDALVERAKAMDMPAVAITDHGNLFGAIEFYNAAVKAGVKPIIGLEAYMAPGHREDRQTRGIKGTSYHLLLLAMNIEGYHNLLKLGSIGYLEGFYYKPRIDKEVLKEFSGGLICTSTCLSGEIPSALVADNRKAAEEVAKTYLGIFGPDRFLMELQDHGIEDQQIINPELVEMANRLGVAIVATNDVHYLEQDDAESHDVLCCISTRSLVTDADRFKFPCNEFYLKSPEQMQSLFVDYPDAISNTLRVADMCDVELDFSARHAPAYKLPDSAPTDDPNEYLRELVWEGARGKYPEITDELKERIEYELDVISGKGFSGYFLIVWDFVRYARSRGIPCGARGSACSSVVAHCLDISAPDPLRYGLYFERFLDPDRDEMPDIDVDICQAHRGEVIDYVRNKYGHVAQIITFGKLKARAAVKDVARVLGLGFEEANELTNLIPNELHMTIDRALEAEPELKKRYAKDEKTRKIIDIARRLEGLARHAGVHAAGIVVADTPLDRFLPLYKPPNETQVVTQFDGVTVERIGLLKFDFLGLRTLTVLERARQLAERSTGKKIDLDHLDLSDQRVYELFARGDTRGVFQFESGGMRDVIMRMKPNRIEDLIAANALFRPGPMQYIDSYIARKHGEKWTTAHDTMSSELAETFGIMVYQEQVSRIVNRLGGIELKRAFRLAKSISKKKTTLIEAEREPFLVGCEANGLSRTQANRVFDDILKFGGYAFNKAHSTGYALVAFQTAYMKAYYPVEFMAALLSLEMSNSDKVVEYIEECKRLGITVLPPDINESEHEFAVESIEREGEKKTAIRFGLGAVKGVGEKAVAAIERARSEGDPFADIYDFTERVDLGVCNRAAVEALVNCGAFDKTGAMRKALTMVLESAMEHGAEIQRDKRSGQMGLFGEVASESVKPTIPGDEWAEAEMLAREKAALGFYITKHPLASHRDLIEACTNATTIDLQGMKEKTEVVIGGIVTHLRPKLTKGGKKMARVTLEDLKGSIEAIVFPDDLPRFQSMLKPDSIVFLRGQVDRRREEAALRVSEVIPAADARSSFCVDVTLAIGNGGSTETVLADVKALLERHQGNRTVYLEIRAGDDMVVTIKASAEMGICFSDAFARDAVKLLGAENVAARMGDRRPLPFAPCNGGPTPCPAQVAG